MKIPGHRISFEPSDAHVVVAAGGQVLADTRRAVLLHETGLGVRYYIPREDVRMDLLRPTDHRTTCPFKGEASYWSAHVDGAELANVAWTYEEPIPEAMPVQSLVAFYTERLDLHVGD